MEWIKDKLKLIYADFLRSWKSFTVWVNGVALAVLSGLPMAQESFPQLQQYISPNLYKQAMTVLIVANILLRFKTNKALRDK